MLNAVEDDSVDGMLMNQYTASYYLMKLNHTGLEVERKFAADPDLTVGMVISKKVTEVSNKIKGCAIYHFWEKTWLRPEQRKATATYEVCFV